eukprot:TRINITY_DN3569_c0_g1_i1.p1 TRINITY_DN3569_c0_g1~~TRINITY_DN3569_c0_g1_i1.p1  ORF type:complete len:450 (-),score=75.88 TRINITY_DN3569_c0_g1_i1:66-1415(-)
MDTQRLLGDDNGHGHAHSSHSKHKQKKKGCIDFKLISFVIIGGLTLLYVALELGIAVWLKSLALLSDGFHNLSDVISLFIAYWAASAAKRDINDKMSYGWARSEVLGGLTNGCFLLSLCLYVFLEAIPRFINPESIDSSWWFIGVAGGGLVINTLGTVIFAFAGISHGHSHSHGGHGHGDHGHGEHGHGHGKKEKEHGHGHGKKKHGHDHGEKKHDHGHKKKDKHHHDEYEPFEDDDLEAMDDIEMEPKTHKHKSHKKKKASKWKIDLNVWAVFLHYLGDMISSALILIAGLLLHFFQDSTWADYMDPAASVLIVILILWTTFPLVKRCAIILLQSTPSEVEMDSLRDSILGLPGVESLHDLHVWQLVDGMIISSAHIAVEEGIEWSTLVKKIKSVLHEHNIHSSSVQPEFVQRNKPMKPFCEENCVKNCEEDWCCKKTAEKEKDPFDL